MAITKSFSFARFFSIKTSSITSFKINVIPEYVAPSIKLPKVAKSIKR